MAVESATDADWDKLVEQKFDEDENYNFGYNALLRKLFFVNSIAFLRTVRRVQGELEENGEDPRSFTVKDVPNITQEDESIALGK